MSISGRTDLNGTCGVPCEGSRADTIGVMEFDTVSETFVETHQPKEGLGAKAQASPDGQYIVLFPNDGGKNIRVLRAEDNGQASTVAFDISLNFENGLPGAQVISDFAFVEWKDRSILALASGYDNNLALADLSTDPPTVTKVLLSSSASPTGGGSTGRMVEWAYGTEYLWVDGSANEEVYVLKLDDNGGASLHRTITNAPTSKMIYVENFAQRAVQNLMADFMTTIFTQSSDGSSSNTGSGNSDIEGSDLLLEKLEEAGLLTHEDDEKASFITVLALVIACVSLSINVVIIVKGFISASTGAAKEQGTNNQDKEQTKSTDIPDDSKTLGSKQVA